MGLWMGVEGIFSGCWYLIFRFFGGIVVQSVKFRYIVLTFVSEYDTILVTRGCGRILAVGFLGVVVSERRSRKIYGAERMLAFSERNKFSRLRSRLGFPACRKSASPRWVAVIGVGVTEGDGADCSSFLRRVYFRCSLLKARNVRNRVP